MNSSANSSVTLSQEEEVARELEKAKSMVYLRIQKHTNLHYHAFHSARSSSFPPFFFFFQDGGIG